MARRNIILGNGRGKLGDIVLYRQNGQQISRIRVTPKNPRSAGQSVQRMILASASKTLAALRNLYNHSFEGIAVGQKSTQHAQSLLMNLYRGVAAAGLSGETPVPDSVNETVFAIKGAPIAGIVAGQPMSRGSLTLGAYEFDEQDTNVLHLAISAAPSTINSQATYAAALASLGLEPGDQLTVIVYSQNPTGVVAETDTAVNRADAYRYARITFAPELPEGFTGALIENDAFNPALISKSEGTFPAVNTTVIDGDSFLAIEVGGLAPIGFFARGAAVVRSEKDSAGKTRYNNANFVVNTNFGILPGGVYPSYMDGASVINVGETLYLKNAEAAPFA